MKKLILLFIALFTLIAVQAQTEFVIDGLIDNIEDGTKIELLRRGQGEGSGSISVDNIKNGKFKLTGSTSLLVEQLYLTVYKDNMPFFSRAIWISPNTTTLIKGDNLIVDVWDVQNEVKEQQELNAYLLVNKDDLIKQHYLVLDMMSSMKELRANKDSEKGEALKAHLDSIQNVMRPLSVKVMEREVKILNASEPSVVWMEKLLAHARNAKNPSYPLSIEDIQRLYDKMNDEQKQTAVAKEIRLAIFPPQKELIGKKALDANLLDLNGNYHRLADYREKYVLVDFWASWCGPCIMAIPEIKEIQEKYKEQLTIVGINLDGDEGVWKTATESHGLSWENLSEGKTFGQGLHAEYKGDGIPYYVLISPDGTVLDIWAGYRKEGLKHKMVEHIK